MGRVIGGKWRLDALLGVGGMAAVYAGQHRNAKRVAIKILHAEVAASEVMRTRFLREGYVANNVDHRAVVSVLDDDVDADGTTFIVMELLEGESIGQRRDRQGRRLQPLEVLTITDQLLDVLQVAHTKGVVHRDLKPENLFITTDGQLKVLDFGIARLKDLTQGASGTQTGVPMGTPAYMPPEQARGRWEAVDERSDLWSVGATMFALLAGRVIHDGETLPELLVSAMHPVPPVRSKAPEIPEAIAPIIDRAMAYEKDDRWQNAEQMRQAVRNAIALLGGSIVTSEISGAFPSAASLPRIDLPAVNTAYAATLPQSGAGTAAPTVDASAGKRRRKWIAGVAGAVVGLAVAAAVVSQRLGADSTAAEKPEAAAAPMSEGEATVTPPTPSIVLPLPRDHAVPAPTRADAGASAKPSQKLRPQREQKPATSSAPKREGVGPLSEDL